MGFLFSVDPSRPQASHTHLAHRSPHARHRPVHRLARSLRHRLRASPWSSVTLGDTRDSAHSKLDNLNIPVSSTPDANLQTNTDFPLILPGLLYPLPVMVTFRFDANSRLAEITLNLDLPAMRRDWAALGSDEALYNFADDKLAFALAGAYGAPSFSSPACNAEAPTTPCTTQWRDANRSQVIQLERIPNGHHLRIDYLPLAFYSLAPGVTPPSHPSERAPAATSRQTSPQQQAD